MDRAGEELLMRIARAAGIESEGGGFPSTGAARLASIARSEAALELALGMGMPTGLRDDLGLTALHHAAREGKSACAAKLIGAGAEVDARDQGGKTPLHRAAWHGHARCAELLLAAGADPEARSQEGKTPRDSARSGVRSRGKEGMGEVEMLLASREEARALGEGVAPGSPGRKAPSRKI